LARFFNHLPPKQLPMIEQQTYILFQYEKLFGEIIFSVFSFSQKMLYFAEKVKTILGVA
jgi:hypothetical protein